MEYITTKEASARWGISPTRITILANQGRISGARRIGKSWLIPADASKPADLRASRSNSAGERNGESSFSFPLYPFRPDWKPGMEAGLSRQEKKLLQAETAVQECRFKEAYSILETILQAPDSIDIEICGLMNAGICTIGLSRPYDFFRIFFRLQTLLSDDFPHRSDYTITLDVLRTYVDTISSATSLNADSTDVHIQFLPLLCLQVGYANLAKECMGLGEADPVLLEIILRYLETTDAVAATESLHLYLVGIYSIRQMMPQAEKHAKAAVQIAFETGCYFPLVTYFRYFIPVLTPILEQYPPEFQETLQTLIAEFVPNYIAFISALNEDAGFSRLSDEDYPYIGAVMQSMPNKFIAARLGISEPTVKRRLGEICDKLGVNSKKALRDYLRDYL